MKKYTRNLAIAAVLGSLAVSQTGCLLGLVAWPLWIVGAFVGAVGVGTMIGGAGPVGFGILMAGLILDAKNPGRSDALNELPMVPEYAQAAHVKVSDLRSYNRGLDQVRKVGAELAEDIRSQISRKELAQVSKLEQLSRDPQIDHLAIKYGFENGEAFFNSFQKKLLPAETLARFAKNMDLTEAQAKLLLYYGFGVQSE